MTDNRILRIGRVFQAPAEAVFDAWTSNGGGRYTECDPPTRLAFTWIWDGDTRRTLIELNLEETTRQPPTHARRARTGG